MVSKNIKIRLESFNHVSLVNATQMISDSLAKLTNEFSGPIPLPTKIKRYCLLRSPHVDKDSREHFEIRIHRRIIEANVSFSDLTEQLKDLGLSRDVSISFQDKTS
uniref:Ribosomal protein S10 n=1 Tax=Olisthodiscus luteus TaxID=83000 RepID=A0A7U0QGE6_OLILU|nr:ribosomal protein S10 [Olisthodiscus luteus]QQW50605.1 ribosomal protein S10 [Olisthodiscus luteus]